MRTLFLGIHKLRRRVHENTLPSGRSSGLSPQPALTDRAHGSLPFNVPYLPDFIPDLAACESINVVIFALPWMVSPFYCSEAPCTGRGRIIVVYLHTGNNCVDKYSDS